MPPVTVSRNPVDRPGHIEFDIHTPTSSPSVGLLSASIAGQAETMTTPEHFDPSPTIMQRSRRYSTGAISPEPPTPTDLRVTSAAGIPKYHVDDDNAPLNLTSASCDIISMLPVQKTASETGSIAVARQSYDGHANSPVTGEFCFRVSYKRTRHQVFKKIWKTFIEPYQTYHRFSPSLCESTRLLQTVVLLQVVTVSSARCVHRTNE